jgi:hypothetical protein
MKVAFYKDNSHVFNALVSWWTRGPYSHCELIIGYTGDGKAICYSSSFRDGGVRLKIVDLIPEHWDIVDIGGTESDAIAAVAWFAERVGAKYDVMGLVGCVFRSVADDRDKYYCSEAVAAAVGFPESWRMDPNTLYSVFTRAASLPEKVGAQQPVVVQPT